MNSLAKYIQALDFEYVISFSGLRGEKFANLEIEYQKKIQELEKEIETTRFMQILKLKKQIQALSTELNLPYARIIDKDGNLHQSTSQVHRFENGSKELKAIIHILNTNFREGIVAACAPTFRDALVFYSKEGNIKGILQICFSCYHMENENRERFMIDHRIYSKLKKELVQVGHKIEK